MRITNGLERCKNMNLEQEFKRLKRHYRDNEFEQIFSHELGLYFLKMRSVSRAPILRRLAAKGNINVESIKGRVLFEYMFCQDIDRPLLDEFIDELYEEERNERRANEEELYSQLYRLSVFYWGGFYQNAVEQTIVNNYIKKIQNYDELLDKIENDLNPRLRGYILCSWYNHWTSILIEDMFKDHLDVLPAVGLIKKVDFFWNNFPFDLKVTYFPEGFIKEKRKKRQLRPEFTELKQMARKLNIPIDKNLREKESFTLLLTRISESQSEEAQTFIQNFHQTRRKIINEAIRNPEDLIRWFYENQGIRRFDASNRFFLVLIDSRKLEESWKLKRNKELLCGNITNYLNNNKNINFNKLKISFNWQDRTYMTYSTILFIMVE